MHRQRRPKAGEVKIIRTLLLNVGIVGIIFVASVGTCYGLPLLTWYQAGPRVAVEGSNPPEGSVRT